jgi:GGDEF domain-containing protein
MQRCSPEMQRCIANVHDCRAGARSVAPLTPGQYRKPVAFRQHARWQDPATDHDVVGNPHVPPAVGPRIRTPGGDGGLQRTYVRTAFTDLAWPYHPWLPTPPPAMASDSARSAQYSKAFATLTQTPFASLDDCLDTLLCTGLVTLDLTRVAQWLFEGEGGNQIHCQRATERPGFPALGGMRIPRASCPRYFDALRTDLVIDAGAARHDARTEELVDNYLEPQGIRALLDAPVRIFGTQVGVLCSECDRERSWDLPDRNFAAALATLVGLALEHAELLRTREQLRAAAGIEIDTGVPTALYLEQVLSLAASRRDPRLPGSWLVRCELWQQASLQASLSAGALRELYRQLATRMRAQMPGLLECAHLGEGEFLLWLADLHADAETLYGALEHCLEAPFEMEGQALLLTPRCGVRRLGNGTIEPAPALLLDVATALAAARSNGERLVQHSAALELRQQAALGLEQRVRHAARQQQFGLHLQPMIELSSGRLTGLEALIRWQHAPGEWLTPAAFLPVLLETGLIVPIGHALLRQALTTVAKLQQDLGRPDLGLSFNLAGPELRHPHLLELVRE